MNNKNPALTLIEIEPNAKAERSIIWLHGLGADGNDFVPMIPELKLPNTKNVRFIFPNAPIMPVTLNNGYQMPAWYDIYGLGHGKIDSDGIAKSREAVAQIIDNEINRGIDSQHILLGGFSQGAVIALNTGLIYNKPLAGIVALSGYLPHADQVIAQASGENKSIPIFMAHGTEDPLVPFMSGMAAHEALKRAGYAIAWHAYKMPHTVCGEEIRDISDFVKKQLAL